jgi:hypothetical protein
MPQWEKKRLSSTAMTDARRATGMLSSGTGRRFSWYRSDMIRPRQSRILVLAGAWYAVMLSGDGRSKRPAAQTADHTSPSATVRVVTGERRRLMAD